MPTALHTCIFFLTFVEKNPKGATPWNVKKATYSYNSPEMATKRPIGSPPTNEITSPPTAKRRGNAAMFDMVRPTNEQKTAAHFTTHTGGKYTYGLYIQSTQSQRRANSYHIPGHTQCTMTSPLRLSILCCLFPWI